jgi:Tol biopolymer transport system component
MARSLSVPARRLGRPLVGLLALACAGDLGAQTPVEPANVAPLTFRPTPRRFAKLDVPLHPSVAPSPDGRFFAALQTRPDPVLWIVPTDGAEPFALRKMWAAYKPRWSPSGNRIGFIAAVGPPRIWTVEMNPASGRPMDPPRLLYRTGANAFALAPEGERVAFVPRRTTAAGASEIHIVEWESRRVRRLLREDGMIYRLDWSPDGAFIYYGLAPNAPADSTHRVVRARLSNGSAQTVLHVQEFLGLAPDGSTLLYRPADLDESQRDILELALASGEALVRIAVPAGATPTWGATAASLVQIRASEAGDEIWEIPTPALWCLFAW